MEKKRQPCCVCDEGEEAVGVIGEEASLVKCGVERVSNVA